MRRRVEPVGILAHFYLAARARTMRAEFAHYYIVPHFSLAVNRQIAQRLNPEIVQYFFKKVLTYERPRVIMYLQGKEREVNKMALNKAIMSGKEHRKMYRGSKAIDRTCRNHGSCCWCCENRQYKNLKRLQKTLDMMKDF